MSRIRLLPNDVVDQIAAGEVIERPASVVKELVENAVDAGARRVEIDVAGGGLIRITITDDGAGMDARDAELCLTRHATSKLSRAGDLFDIRTLGFRGEALSSIAAVCRLTLTTRRIDDDVGTRVVMEGGETVSVESVGCPAGTTIDVRDLFFNTPARRKFMRSPATEQAHIVDATLRVLLGARAGGVVLRSGTRRLLDLPEMGAEEERVRAALGRRVDRVFPFAHERDGVRVSGYVTRPEVDRADTRGMSFFVNGRYVRDRMLQRAVLDGFRSMVERGRYPIAVVYVDLDPGAVDVNVHPQKSEVRFSDSGAVFRGVSSAVTSVLAQTPWVQSGNRTGAAVADLRAQWAARNASAVREARPAGYTTAGPEADDVRPAQAPSHAPAPLPGLLDGGYFSSLDPIGQALGVYLVCQGNGEIVLIDQHAAAERVAFERLRAQAATGSVERQPLLFPDALDVPTRLQALLEERAESLVAFGFEVEPTGPNRWAVRAIPAALTGADASRLVQDLLDELDTVGGDAAAKEMNDALLSRCACHAVVRSGDKLGRDEIAALLGQLDRIDFGANCPHGRPVYHRLSRAELDKLFHR